MRQEIEYLGHGDQNPPEVSSWSVTHHWGRGGEVDHQKLTTSLGRLEVPAREFWEECSRGSVHPRSDDSLVYPESENWLPPSWYRVLENQKGSACPDEKESLVNEGETSDMRVESVRASKLTSSW